MDPLLSFLVGVIMLALLAYLLFYVLARLSLPEPVRVVILVLVALFILVYFAQRFSLFPGF